MLNEQQITSDKQSFNPSTIFPSCSNVSHGVLTLPGPIIVTSGQVGINVDGSIPETIEEQVKICFENIDLILSEGGMHKSNIIRLNAFIINRVYLTSYINLRDHFLADIPVKPASSMKIISGFSRPEFLVEIEAIAVNSNIGQI